VNVDRRWWGTSVKPGRILAGSLVLLAAGCAVLGAGSRFAQSGSANAAAMAVSSIAMPGLASAKSAAPEPETQVRAGTFLSGLPLTFEPNQGQGNLNAADERARFLARGSGYGLFLGSQGATLTLLSRDHSHESAAAVNVIEMKLAGANPSATLMGVDRLPGKSNYFVGNDASKWRVGVPHFSRVQYKDVYPGIN
jgi:hypothetical protein